MKIVNQFFFISFDNCDILNQVVFIDLIKCSNFFGNFIDLGQV